MIALLLDPSLLPWMSVSAVAARTDGRAAGGGCAAGHSLVEVGLLGGLLAALECLGVLVLQRLQVGHGLHALRLQTLVVVAHFGIWPV